MAREKEAFETTQKAFPALGPAVCALALEEAAWDTGHAGVLLRCANMIQAELVLTCPGPRNPSGPDSVGCRSMLGAHL